jgi:hypothetical protein
MKYAVIEFVFVCYLVLICAIGARGAVIEAEDYNQGGEGVAYHDSDAENHGNTDLRPDEGVDLWNIGDGVVKIGSVQAGEWVTFNYDFPAAGSYKITLHTATPHDAAGIILYLDGVEIQRWQALPNTGAYSSFTTVDAETTVDAGVHTIKIEFAGQSSDMDKLEIALVNEQPTVEPPAGAFQLFDYATYYGETGQQIQMAWDPVSNADRYEVRLFNQERGVIVELDDSTTPGLSLTFSLPYSGHFVGQVRACNDTLDPNCSEWALSTDPEHASVNGEPRAWWLYGHVAEPGGVDFISNR